MLESVSTRKAMMFDGLFGGIFIGRQRITYKGIYTDYKKRVKYKVIPFVLKTQKTPKHKPLLLAKNKSQKPNSMRKTVLNFKAVFNFSMDRNKMIYYNGSVKEQGDQE